MLTIIQLCSIKQKHTKYKLICDATDINNHSVRSDDDNDNDEDDALHLPAAETSMTLC